MALGGSQPPRGDGFEPPAAPAGSYDEVDYPGHAFPQSHPERLAVNAALFGLDPAPPRGARVLELGCGDGGNLVPMAVGLPGAELVGVDLAEQPIESARDIARSLGLSNVWFHRLDVRNLPEDIGAFDYVIAHGVYSWVPEPARDALLAACRRHLTPRGIAYVSYNAYPGSHLRNMARDILRFHVARAPDAATRLGQARALIQMIVEADIDHPYARVLREYMQGLVTHPDSALYHDDFSDVNHPVYFHEFVAHAEGHGLRYVCEAELRDSQLDALPEHVAETLEGLGDDVLLREQYIDFLRNRMFRQTLLCPAEAEVGTAIVPEALDGLWVSSRARAMTPSQELAEDALAMRFTTPTGASIEADDPCVRAALAELSEAWPQALRLDELVRRTSARVPSGRPGFERTAEVVADLALRGYLVGLVELRTRAPAAVRSPGPRPRVSALARLQAERGLAVMTSLLHETVRLETPIARALLTTADGSLDRAGLLAELARLAREDGTAQPTLDELEAGLAGLAELGLLEA